MNFQALFHITPWTKAVAFVTSQIDNGELIGEYFLLLIDEKGKVKKKGLGIHYPPNVLKLVCPDGAYGEYGLQEMRSQVTNELAAILGKLFCRQTPSGALDPRYKLAVETPTLRPASMAYLASVLPEKRELHFVYQTRNAELKQFLDNVFFVKEVVRSYPME
ncbi:MAG: hypothetical protein ACFFCW_23420 [Candidatus Hodarchaeota archaeon]